MLGAGAGVLKSHSKWVPGHICHMAVVDNNPPPLHPRGALAMTAKAVRLERSVVTLGVSSRPERRAL